MNRRPDYLATAEERAEWDALMAARDADPDNHGLYLLAETIATDPEGSGTIDEYGADYPALRAAAAREAFDRRWTRTRDRRR